MNDATEDRLASEGGSRISDWSIRNPIRRMMKEPLTHFLGISTILFFGLAAAEQPDDAIDVDRAALVQFMQERARIYDEETFSALYDRLTPAERSELLSEYTMSEALYQTAKASSLEQVDPLIRQRLTQQMRLLLQDQASSQIEVSQEEVQDYFSRNRRNYAQPASLTFTHVFVDRRKHGRDAESMAHDLLADLRRRNVGFEKAGNFGDLFPYRRNYIDVSRRQIGGELGNGVLDRLFSSDLTTGEWHGPFQSELGEHLVFVSSRREQSSPELEDVLDQVREDALFEKRAMAAEEAAQTLIDQFRIVVADDVGELAEPS